MTKTSTAPAKRPPRVSTEPELTTKIGRSIVEAIGAGNFPSVVARIVGLKPGQLTKWLERGESGEQPFADFKLAVDRAEARCEEAALAKWQAAGAEDWRAQERFMSKRFVHRWSDRTQLPDRGEVVSMFAINIHAAPRPDWIEAARQRQLAQEQAPVDPFTNRPRWRRKNDPDSKLN